MVVFFQWTSFRIFWVYGDDVSNFSSCCNFGFKLQVKQCGKCHRNDMASAKTHVFNSSQHLTCQSIHESKHEQIRNHQHHVHCQKKRKTKTAPGFPHWNLGGRIPTSGCGFGAHPSNEWSGTDTRRCVTLHRRSFWSRSNSTVQGPSLQFYNFNYNWINASGYILGFSKKQFSFWPRAAELTVSFLRKTVFIGGICALFSDFIILSQISEWSPHLTDVFCHIGHVQWGLNRAGAFALSQNYMTHTSSHQTHVELLMLMKPKVSWTRVSSDLSWSVLFGRACAIRKSILI